MEWYVWRGCLLVVQQNEAVCLYSVWLNSHKAEMGNAPTICYNSCSLKSRINHALCTSYTPTKMYMWLYLIYIYCYSLLIIIANIIIYILLGYYYSFLYHYRYGVELNVLFLTQNLIIEEYIDTLIAQTVLHCATVSGAQHLLWAYLVGSGVPPTPCWYAQRSSENLD